MKVLSSKSLRWLVSLVLLGLVICFADWRHIWQTLRGVEPKWIAFALGLAAADRIITSIRWMILLWAANVRLGFEKLLRIQLAANFLGSFLPGSIGVDGLRIAALRVDKQPMSAAIAATMVDRISLAFATLVVGAVMLFIFANKIVPPEVSRLVLVAAVAVSVAGAICLLKPVRTWVRLTIVPLAPQRFQKILHDVADASLAYRSKHGALFEVTVLTMLLFVIRIWGVQTMARAVGVDLHFLQLAVVIPILWLIVMLPISVGGVGLQDASYVALLSFLGLSAPVALSISLIEHALSRLICLPGVLFVRDLTGGRRPKDVQAGADPKLRFWRPRT